MRARIQNFEYIMKRTIDCSIHLGNTLKIISREKLVLVRNKKITFPEFQLF